MSVSLKIDEPMPEWEVKLNSLMERERKQNMKANSSAIGANILLRVQTKDEKICFRYASSKDDGNAQEPYFIASQTKMFTAAVVFQLLDEGLISGLDDRISKYLAAELIEGIHVYKGNDYSFDITVGELLQQTSGLADYFLEKGKTSPSLFDKILLGQDELYTIKDVTETVRNNLSPKFEPSANKGKKSHYSDTNYQLLGAIIESVTGRSVAENFKSRIFRPLGMSDQTYVYDYRMFVSDGDNKVHPMPFYHKDKELNVPLTMSSFGPDGGIVSTIDDMLVFMKGYFDGKLFNKVHLDKIPSQQQWNTVFSPPLQYGSGLMRFKLPWWMTFGAKMPVLIGHSGANASFSFYAPEEEVFVVGTFNRVDQESRPFAFMLQVLNCLK